MLQVLEDWYHHSHTVSSLMRNANNALLEMFDHYTASEWIEQKIYPMFTKVSQIRNLADNMKTVKTWPSRPYPPLETLTSLGIGIPVNTNTQKQAHAQQPEQNRVVFKEENVYYQPQFNNHEPIRNIDKVEKSVQNQGGFQPLTNSLVRDSEQSNHL